MGHDFNILDDMYQWPSFSFAERDAETSEILSGLDHCQPGSSPSS